MVAKYTASTLFAYNFRVEVNIHETDMNYNKLFDFHYHVDFIVHGRTNIRDY